MAKITNPLKNNPKQNENQNQNQNQNNKNGKGRGKNKNKKYPKIIPPKSQGLEYWKYSLGINMFYIDYDCHNNKTIHLFDLIGINMDMHV